ncbi:MAG: thioether cross-link-forming SCIFF peptide maturase [Clostridiales bacterium]|jgi:uncharacterized protein|nr:thioether cross-link-forming SCIFF peptide maturase [Clostridiales bacterium]
MVHLFEMLGSFFCLDVPSGSVITTDRLTYLLLMLRNGVPGALGELSTFSGEERAEAEAEIDGLIAEGVIFSPEIPDSVRLADGVVKAMCLNVTHDCNLRCKYCFADGGAYGGKRGSMSLDTAKAAIDMLLASSGTRRNLEVDFFGGEPMLNFETVKQTVAYARACEGAFGKRIRFTLTTNATVMDEGSIDFLNREMSNVVLSIDGRSEVHDSMRRFAGGRGSFARAKENALKFRAARGDKDYYVRGTYTAENLDFCSDVLFLNDCGFDKVSIEPAVLPAASPYALGMSNVDKLKGEYLRLAEEYYKRRSALGRDKFSFFHFMMDLSGGPCEKKRLLGCGAGAEYVAVSPDGGIFPCHQFIGRAEFGMGNVFDGLRPNGIPERFSANTVSSKDGCKKCWAKYYCSGGCAANAYNLNGRLDAPVDYLCELQKTRTECAIAVAALEASDGFGTADFGAAANKA